MKRTKLIIKGLFTPIAVTLLFVQCNNKQTDTNSPVLESTANGEVTVPAGYLPIAYVDSDSIQIHFDFYNGLIGTYEDKLSKQQTEFNKRIQNFQSEAEKFEEKRQNNAFLTQERFVQEQTRLQRMQQEIEKRGAQMEQELVLEQRMIQQQLSDSLAVGIKEFNTPQKYQMILTKSGNNIVLYADDHYDITNDVIDFLNKRFKRMEE
ncbi:MAG: OmpH family outer membrane protein [Dysgonamonadaceae bacterium]|jgi:outer membrane protein|nr:OmpH family outer membrane protein [Dysgonamonadaceae bacterium]